MIACLQNAAIFKNKFFREDIHINEHTLLERNLNSNRQHETQSQK